MRSGFPNSLSKISGWLGQWLFWAENPSGAETYRETIIPGWRREYADLSGIEAGLLYDGTLCGMIGLHHLDQINQKGNWLLDCQRV